MSFSGRRDSSDINIFISIKGKGCRVDADTGKGDVCHQEKEGVTFQELFFCQVEGESNCLEREKERDRIQD